MPLIPTAYKLKSREWQWDVCAEARAADTAERDLRSLVEAGRIFPRAQKRLLTLTQDGLPREVPVDVLAHPAYVWALMPPDAA